MLTLLALLIVLKVTYSKKKITQQYRVTEHGDRKFSVADAALQLEAVASIFCNGSLNCFFFSQ